MNFSKIFENEEFGKLRVIQKDDDSIWFVAKDVCDVLGLENSRKAVGGLDEDERNIVTISDGIPGNPNMSIINESGLYSLILRSRKPKAKVFKKWITSEVLPSIRKNGGYIDGQEKMTPEQLMANAVIMAQNIIDDLKNKNRKLQADKIRSAPKLKTFDTFLDRAGLLNLSETGKEITGHPNTFINQLITDGILFRRGKRLLPKAQYDKKYFHVKETFNDYNLTWHVQTFVTPEGRAWLAKQYGNAS